VTDYYIDASALVKRYTREPGSTWVSQITEPSAQHTILLAEVTLAEVAAALAAKQRAAAFATARRTDSGSLFARLYGPLFCCFQ
jgi:predicted nucleic acid-binding protein